MVVRLLSPSLSSKGGEGDVRGGNETQGGARSEPDGPTSLTLGYTQVTPLGFRCEAGVRSEGLGSGCGASFTCS